MSMSTQFTHVETTLLPLPPPKPGQTREGIAKQGLQVALSLLQDHHFMMELSQQHLCHKELEATETGCVNVENLASLFKVPLTEDSKPERVNGGCDWKHYQITDQLPILLNYKSKLIFHTAIRNTETGMETLTDPGHTVTIHSRYDVSIDNSDLSTIKMVERSVTNCNFFLSFYIKSNLASSHAENHMTIKARFVEEMQKKREN